MRTVILGVLIVLTLGITQHSHAVETLPAVVLKGEKVAVEAECREGRLRERYLAIRDGAWVEVATGDQGKSIGPVSVVAEGGKPLAGTVQKISLAGGSLVEELTAGAHRIIRTLTITADGSWIRAVSRFEPSGRASLHAFVDQLNFSHKSQWSFSPSVGGFNPDAEYKAPLILVQADREALGIVPDVAVLHREELKRCNHALYPDVLAGPMLAVGFMPARLASHSVYAPDLNRSWSADKAVENAYYVLVTATADPGQAYRQAVRFHWAQFGRAEQSHAADEQVGTEPRYRKLALWDDWRKMVWDNESTQSWLTIPLADGSIGGGARTQRWGPGPSVYLSSWFNTLRTSFGMALYARRTGNEKLLKLATETVNLALKAPGRYGAFKCIAVPIEGGKKTLWAAGDGCGGSTENGFLGYDMSWTGYWLLKWRAAHLPGSRDIMPRCEKLASFLIDRQAEDGLLPTRFNEDGSVDEKKSREVKAETGPVVLFLLELYSQDRDPAFLAAARRGMDFLERQVIPLRQWYDYETFWSCSPRGAGFDARTQQWPANDLALGQTVAAYLLASRVTGEARYLATGESLLDYLLLYQQCWTNPALENLSGSAMLLGGFTTQNSDAEWSDARQSQFGGVLLDYYRATGKAEYLERGVAALRAQFPVSPSENWAHQGYGGKAGVSSFHWGTGSGMAGIEIDDDYLHDAVVDVPSGRGVGVNGLNVVGCAVHGNQIRLEIHTPFTWARRPVVVFHRAEPARRYQVLVNDADAGTWSGAELEKGIPFTPDKGK